jgi:hypothetical protein
MSSTSPTPSSSPSFVPSPSPLNETSYLLPAPAVVAQLDASTPRVVISPQSASRCILIESDLIVARGIQAVVQHISFPLPFRPCSCSLTSACLRPEGWRQTRGPDAMNLTLSRTCHLCCLSDVVGQRQQTTTLLRPAHPFSSFPLPSLAGGGPLCTHSMTDYTHDARIQFSLLADTIWQQEQ